MFKSKTFIIFIIFLFIIFFLLSYLNIIQFSTESIIIRGNLQFLLSSIVQGFAAILGLILVAYVFYFPRLMDHSIKLHEHYEKIYVSIFKSWGKIQYCHDKEYRKSPYDLTKLSDKEKNYIKSIIKKIEKCIGDEDNERGNIVKQFFTKIKIGINKIFKNEVNKKKVKKGSEPRDLTTNDVVKCFFKKIIRDNKSSILEKLVGAYQYNMIKTELSMLSGEKKIKGRRFNAIILLFLSIISAGILLFFALNMKEFNSIFWIFFEIYLVGVFVSISTLLWFLITIGKITQI